MRYAALRADRVEVRYVVNSDREVLDDIATKTRQGASFATLALRHTEDANKLDRGLLPAFGRSFDHPVTEVAFELDVGQLSDIFIRESQGSKRYYLVYCLRKIPGRDVPYADVKAELDREIETHPLTAIEFRAAAMCLKARTETLNSGPPKR
jgi:parvulin-like peptidyl-prolyl isomerase